MNGLVSTMCAKVLYRNAASAAAKLPLYVRARACVCVCACVSSTSNESQAHWHEYVVVFNTLESIEYYLSLFACVCVSCACVHAYLAPLNIRAQTGMDNNSVEGKKPST